MVCADVLRSRRKGLCVLWLLVAAWLCLNVLDIHSTWIGLKEVGFDTDYELNPIARKAMEEDGIAATAESKLLYGSLVVLVMFGAYPCMWYWKRPAALRVYLVGTSVLVAAYVWVVSTNYLRWFLLS